MKIHFSNVNFSSSTGPNTFAIRLADILSQRGHQIVDQNELYDIFLCFIEPASIPRINSRIIHRLDGIWFKPEEFHKNNQGIKWIFDKAHSVIWQSNFDKKMTDIHWGSKHGSVIHNGIDLKNVDITNLELKALRTRFNRIFVSSASWHLQKRLKENIEFYIKNRNEGDALLVLGNNPDYIISGYNIFYLGHCSHEICLQIYSLADWMIHLAWLDHCPNVVVEALSQNCPVICTNSGGTHEIVRNNGIILNEDEIYNFTLLDYDSPYTLTTHVKHNNLEKININCDYLNIEKICDQYLDVMKWD